ncbi:MULTISPECIES: Na+/H+ antiporter [unclassified Paenibacillus]|uniref:Na+/H+ antiporter n=1 Tax=unclassified Paenibacillus TaxID=185978 RepID=UPI00240713EE|nr:MULTISPECIES: Na+/H+ antiporter [unclassified Paenibacillus]MDF9844347.1 Na+/H+ antiporter [Paenibacillus sp. PastF-2]MDF9850951.1 Na+/H+ antiporter [Paenibacillus sp. PastM-2]MDF9857522.1 Na+/H+ antiporter [Paenibacillus sp. PastF-1]MDH6482837.1 Na+/H+ antiporter [Paenibacillus sp. PastH-2]MDH6510262.1 Na+/H+ antiporter [Paenibacillus sp. PastM-3]
MELFEYILLMLAALAVSNLVNRFIPSVSVPIIQIALGVAITLLPLHFDLTLNPELFLLLFIAPLLFNDGRHADKEALWSLRKPILLLALGLVFVTVGIVGYFVNWLLPVIPLAASFALAAALAPTDAIAVGALEQKVKIPHRTMQLLEGESLINDASGLVSFQFAAAAMVTGMFSFRSAGLSFLGISLGGIVLGLLLTLIKYGVVKWLRKLGMENVTLHMLIEILTPFLIFMAAEELGVNGILAVVAAGIAHSFNYKKMNPEVAKLRIVSKSTWSVIIFVLNGLVFLLLGTQLPEIIQTIWNSPEIGNVRVILYTLLLTLAVLGLRLIWVLLMKVPGDSEAHPGPRKSRFKTALILALSGVRGTITLASTLSLPFFLDDGSAFPSRDLIIFLASGVILWTLLASNYLLPLLLGPEAQTVQEEEETQAKIEILRSVVAGLNELSTEQNRLASVQIINAYTSRIRMLRKDDRKDEVQRSLGLSVMKWERESTLLALEHKEVDPYTGYRYLNRVNRLLFMHTRDVRYKRELFPVKHWDEVFGILQQARLSRRQRRAELSRLRTRNVTYVLQQLNGLLAEGGEDIEAVSSFILQYERMLLRLTRGEAYSGSRGEYDESIRELARIGIQLERDHLQAMFESGRISRQGMKEMKRDILFMEHDLREETD